MEINGRWNRSQRNLRELSFKSFCERLLSFSFIQTLKGACHIFKFSISVVALQAFWMAYFNWVFAFWVSCRCHWADICFLFFFQLLKYTENCLTRKWRKEVHVYQKNMTPWWLIFYIFSDMFLPIRYGISFDFNRRLCFLFFRFRDEKLTRSHVRNIQDSNVNVDNVKA